MKVSVFVNKIYQERGKKTVVTASNGSEFGPPLLQVELSEQDFRDINPRIGMPIHLILEWDR